MVFMTATIWHTVFLIGMGFLTSALLFQRIAGLTTSNPSSDIPVNQGFQILAFGAFYGAVDYLGGIALSYHHGRIMDMISFDSMYFSKTTTVATVITDPSGQTSTTATIAKYYTRTKDFLALDEILSYWPDLFWAQHLLKAALPYAYIAMIEMSVVIVFFLTMFMY